MARGSCAATADREPRGLCIGKPCPCDEQRADGNRGRGRVTVSYRLHEQRVVDGTERLFMSGRCVPGPCRMRFVEPLCRHEAVSSTA